MSISSSAKGVALGIVGLSFLDLVIASKNGPAVFGTVVTTPGAWLDAWFDPTKPLIPDLRSTGTSSGGSGGSSGGGASKCVPIPVPGGDAYCAGASHDCSKLFGLSKAICQAGATSSTTAQPGNTATPPTSSSLSALSI